MSYTFKFAGTTLSSLFGVVTKTPGREIAVYDGTLSTIPGRNGDEFIDNKRYKNVPFSREIGFVSRANSSITDIVERVIDWLAYLHGYREFEDTDHPGLVTYAVLTNFSEVVTKLRKHHTAVLRFSRVPFWYSKQGLAPRVFNSYEAAHTGVQLQNPYPIEAEPIFEFTFNDGLANELHFTLQVGDRSRTFYLSDLRYYINASSKRKFVTMNCETKEIKAQLTADGGNIAFSSVALPANIPPYTSSDTYTQVRLTEQSGDIIVNMKLYPRWRCL